MGEIWLDNLIAEGRAQGEHDAIVKALKKGSTPEAISSVMDFSLQYVLEVQKELQNKNELTEA